MSDGMLMVSRDSACLNTPVPRLLSELGKVMSVKAVQPSNAKLPIVVSPSLSAMLRSAVQFANALSPIVVIDRPRESVCKDVQPSKALSPISCTLAGMLMSVSDVHPLNAPDCICSMEFGRVILRVAVLPAKASSAIATTRKPLYMAGTSTSVSLPL